MKSNPEHHEPVRFNAQPWWSAEEVRVIRECSASGAEQDDRRPAAPYVPRGKADGSPDAAARAAAGVLSDLSAHGWGIGGDEAHGTLVPPETRFDPSEEKVRVQAQLSHERRRQLAGPATRAFVRRMESPRLHAASLCSIAALMRDGRELADSLRRAGSDPAALASVVRPYLQVIHGEERCERTGLMLRDVWRYFRHTWANPYKATPGRGMAVLVRDAAVEPHPVIGIALIGSPASQISVRDSWIGWSTDAVLAECRGQPTQARVDWIGETLKQELSEIFLNDLLEDGLLTPAELHAPTAATIARLQAEAVLRRAEHGRFSAASAMKRAAGRAAGDEAAWQRISRAPLYRAKRAEVLAALLSGRAALEAYGGVDVASLPAFARTKVGVAAITTLARRSKARRMGVSVGEISVCGALAPYRDLLGGKLVALLLMSPEVRIAYAERYDEAESVIASAIAGRPVVRVPLLTLLMTTSLYGSGSSQYNRLRLPRSVLGGAEGELKYLELGHTRGFGSSQFSDGTIDALATLISQARAGRRINSVFGEGVNPRLRKAREGLELLGLPAGPLLHHGSPRVVYAIPLAENVGRFLRGLEPEPQWSLSGEDPKAATEAIAEWWRRRWLAARAARSESLAAVERHTLDRPLRHGARVVLPDDSVQLGLFGG